MARYYSGNITLYTTEILAENEDDYKDKIKKLIMDIRHLHSFQDICTRYSVNATYASQEVETKTNA